MLFRMGLRIWNIDVKVNVNSQAMCMAPCHGNNVFFPQFPAVSSLALPRRNVQRQDDQ